MKTNAPPNRTSQDVVPRRGGGQPGNRNALKTGMHVKEARDMRKQVTSARRMMKKLIKHVRQELDERAKIQAKARPKNMDVTNTKQLAANTENRNSSLNDACGKKIKPAPNKTTEVRIDAAKTNTDARANGIRDVSSARPIVPAHAARNIAPGQEFFEACKANSKIENTHNVPSD